ncbi:MAG: glycosyltransferase family 2 protein [Psychrobacter sp.]|nr:glycosyltransferase family 2 protein [Psychrobacter sp.]
MSPLTKKIVSLVIPFYNEAVGVEDFFVVVNQALVASYDSYDFEFVCVNDGSSDETLVKLREQAQLYPQIVIVDLSRNFGKEAALTAGIDIACGDAIIPIDSDLQDPPELIVDMLKAWEEGYEVVLAKRSDRRTDSFLKRSTALWFYRTHNAVSKPSIPENVGDFRLMDRCVITALQQMPEQQRFMKGLFAWVGFKTTTIEYSRQQRHAGDSKFSGWKLWNFAIEGITSFSIAPLKLWTYIGGLGALVAMFYALYIVFSTLILGVEVPGYASLLVTIIFFGSLQLLSIGILGEYIGRIYMEAKRRPIYIVREVFRNKED